MAESYGAFALVLHSHLPYVLSHDRLEEEWLMEAVAESYLPLLQICTQLSRREMSPKVTIRTHSGFARTTDGATVSNNIPCLS